MKKMLSLLLAAALGMTSSGVVSAAKRRLPPRSGSPRSGSPRVSGITDS